MEHRQVVPGPIMKGFSELAVASSHGFAGKGDIECGLQRAQGILSVDL